ncbi:transposable element Tcb1 transposase [Trichonephila clavipes]|nr:transposable element Tcb1 transposase [Trichonephila clavipes]
MVVMDRSVASRTIAQHIESLTYHSVSSHTIRLRLQQSGLSARRPLLGLLLAQNHRRLHRQWCDERRMWAQNGMKLSLLTSHASVCNTTMVGFQSGDTGLVTSIFQQDNARPHVERIVQRFFVNHQIELLSWPARSLHLSPIENMWSMVAQRLSQITAPAATPDHLWQHVEAAWSAVPQEHIQSLFESMPRRVAALISNHDGYPGY